MRGRRVVVTGMGAVSPFGEGVPALWAGVAADACAITRLPDHQMKGLACKVAGLVPPVQDRQIPRALRRSMSPMSVNAVLAAWEALRQAGLQPDAPSGTGVAIGSTIGSPLVMHDFFVSFLAEHSVEDVRSTVFFKIMSHSAAANVAQACGCSGRMTAPAAACASGLEGLCLGFEAIACGRESRMLCGGADEFHLLTAATFERLGAASLEAAPEEASLPFDQKRAGVVCGEGAGIVLLESLECALERNAPIFCEILGASMNSSPGNIAHPNSRAIADCMAQALDDAALRPGDIAFVNAHATATVFGDIAEGQAIEKIFGSETPVASLKGHLGHTMAASGALESILCIAMLNSGMYIPTRGLTRPDAACGRILHCRKISRGLRGPVLKNCFALGGCNCTMIFDTFTKDGSYGRQGNR